jgi:hypothetical protein
MTDDGMIGYAEFAQMIDRRPQSMQVMLMRRRRRIAAGGEALPTDIPEPAYYRQHGQRSEPRWDPDLARDWAYRAGKLADDRVTPIIYRGGGRRGHTKKKAAGRRRTAA